MRTKLVINLFGGPGCGKSTVCADLFALMKWNKLDVEMALEYAKDKVWEQSYNVLTNQVYVFGKQQHRIFRLSNSVDHIITDSPLLLSIFYARINKCSSVEFEQLVLHQFNKFGGRNVNIFLERAKPYYANGRLQSEKEAKEIDFEIKRMLEEFHISYYTVKGDENAKNTILYDIAEII